MVEKQLEEFWQAALVEVAINLAPGAIVKGENRIKSCTKVESGEVV